MLRFAPTHEFDRDMKRLSRRNLNLDLLDEVIDLLLNQQTLPQLRRDHSLSSRYQGFRECHIAPDWLLIYRVERDTLIVSRTGTHSDLFG